MSSTVLFEKDDSGVCRLTLHRPEVRNAFNDDMIKALQSHLDRLRDDAGVRVLLLSGSDATFSSGADLNAMRAMARYDFDDNRADALRLAELLQSLYRFPKPTVARVNGAAFGGALGLIACCDIAIADVDAQFSFSEVRLGIVPAVISPYIVNAIGVRHSRRLFLTARRFGADLAQELGLIHRVAAKDELDTLLQEEIDLLLAAGPDAVTECKRLCDKLGSVSDELVQYTAEMIARLRVSEEGQEGLGAFLEKRKPHWRP